MNPCPTRSTGGPPDDRLRVLTLLPTLEVGGLQASVVGFVRHTAARFNHRVVVLHERRYDELIEQQLRLAGADVVRLGLAGAADRTPVALWKAARGLRRQCLDHRSEVVVSSLFEADLVARSSRLPKGCVKAMRVVNVYPTVEELQKVARSARRARTVRWIDRRTVHRHRTVIAVSPAAALAVEQALDLDAGSVVLVPEGVETADFPVRGSHAEGPVKFVAVGRLSSTKRFDLVVRAARMLVDRGLGDRFAVDLYGSGDQEAVLNALVEELGLGPVVRLRGSTTEVSAVLAEAEVFVMPSERESFGIALVEAMMVGLMPVVSDIDSLRWVSNDLGITFRSGDPESLADAMNAVIDLPTEARLAAGRAARASVIERFEQSRVAASLADHLEAVVDRAR